jgi:hypothetical protein
VAQEQKECEIVSIGMVHMRTSKGLVRPTELSDLRSTKPYLPLEAATDEAFSKGTVLELIRDAPTGEIRLLVSEAGRCRVAERFECDGRIYGPPNIDPFLARAISLPAYCSSYGSTEALFAATRRTLADHGISDEVAQVCTYFVFASWFVRRACPAPCLIITGPYTEAIFLLQLLRCLVWRGLEIQEVDSSGIAAIVEQFRPTLLIDGRHLSHRSLQLLSASFGPKTRVPYKSSILNFAVAKAIYLGVVPGSEFSFDFSIHVHVAPSRNGIRILDERIQNQIIADFQPQFLSYRMCNSALVRNSDFDLPSMHSENRVIARVLGSAVVNAPEIQAGVQSLLEDREQQIREARFIDCMSVIIEVLLAECHGRERDAVRVKEIAGRAQVVLKGRGEAMKLSPRKVGKVLDVLGLPRRRKSCGFRILLTAAVKRRIHSQARDHEVEPVRERTAPCALCAEFFGTLTGVERGEDVHETVRL